MGGSTIDLSIVALEGGEGRAAPLAQLLRFGGRSLSNSQQSLRNAKVLGKAGLTLGGRDLDRWIVNQWLHSPSSADQDEPSQTHPTQDEHASQRLEQPTSTRQQPSPAALNAAERLKCRLNDPNLAPDTALTELVPSSQGPVQELRLNRRQLESLLEKQGLLTALDDLLEQALAGARQHGCQLDNLQGILPVGGGAKLLLLRDWLQRRSGGIPLLEAPPVEAVATGALSLTPGVRVQDVLQRGIALRCWDHRSSRHHWHPLFVAGQTWPSETPLTLVLAAAENNQQGIDLVLGEPDNRSQHEVVFVNGLPTLRNTTATPQVKPLETQTVRLPLNPAGTPGEDCLKLRFRLDDDAELVMEGEDLRTGEVIEGCGLGRMR
jgi:molecular chaperone DnaK (HSP70)